MIVVRVINVKEFFKNKIFINENPLKFFGMKEHWTWELILSGMKVY